MRQIDRIRWVTVCVLAWIAVGPADQVHAAYCGDKNGYTFEIFSTDVGESRPTSCSNGYICQKPQADEPIFELVDPTCDPTVGPCTVRYRLELDFPGNRYNASRSGPTPRIYYWASATAPSCTPSPFDSCGATMICGAGPTFTQDEGRATITRGGVSCSNVGELTNVLSLAIFQCVTTNSCRKRTDVNGLAFGGASAALSIGCPTPPIPESCRADGGAMCSQCLPGGVNADGSTPIFDETSGAGLMSPVGLGYTGGGTGGAGQPGSALWVLRRGGDGLEALTTGAVAPLNPMLGSVAAGLGRYWSHRYSRQIIPDPDAGHVWLATAAGTYHEFTDADGDGLYESAWPSFEKRTLSHSVVGWVLEELDGTVTEFGPDGRWDRTTDPNGNETSAFYSDGRLSTVVLPDGRSITFRYDGAGLLVAISEMAIDGTGSHDWLYTWLPSGDLLRVERPDGTSVELFYEDPAWPGYLTRVDEIGTSGGLRVARAFEYDGSRRVARTWRGDLSATGPDAVDLHVFSYPDGTTTAVTDPLGVTSTWSHDTEPPTGDGAPALRVTQVTGDCPVCGSGPNSRWEYLDPDNPQLPTRVTDGKGHETVFEYDALGMTTRRLEAAHDPSLTRETTWEYAGPFPNLVTRIRRPSVDGMGFRDTVMTYDGATGNLLSRTVSGTEAGQAFSLTTTYAHSPEGYRTEVDPPGYGTADRTSFTYDASLGGQVVSSRTDPLIGSTVYEYDGFGRRTQVTDPNGFPTMTEYDAMNRVVRITREGGFEQDLVTEHVYNEHGDLFRTILPRGNLIEYGYDAAGRLVTVERKPDAATSGERSRYTLDAAGNRVREDLERWRDGVWGTESATAYTYSTRCHLDRVTVAPGTPQESSTEYEYDCNGNLSAQWDGNHEPGLDPPTSSYAYDGLDRLVTVTQPWNGVGSSEAVTGYVYDVQDHLVGVTDAEGNTTTYETSDRDLLTEENSPVSGVTLSAYNEHGELVSTTDARGVTVTRTVDALDRVTFVDYPAFGGKTASELDVTYTYDDPGVPHSLGRLTAVTRRGESWDYEYDPFGRVIRDGDLTVDHDANGNRSLVSYPPNVTASYGFDYADRPVSLEVRVGSDPPRAVVEAADYLPGGPLSNLLLGNGLSESRTFDGRYAPDGIQVTGRLSWAYDTDAVGNVLAITDLLDASQSRSYGYEDVAYYLTRGDGPWGTRSWSYDKIGNRLSETRDGSGDTYEYPWNGTGNTPILDRVALSVGGTRDYAYGPAGHLEQVTAGANRVVFDSDAEGRLSTLSRPAADATARFAYDGRSYLTEALEVEPEIFADDFEAGHLACWSNVIGGAKSGVCSQPPPPPGPTVAPVYSSEGLLHSRVGPSSTEHVLYFAGRPVALLEVTAGVDELTYLTTDHLGTPILATTELGADVWSGGFEPFGEDWNGAGGAGVFLRLPGQWESAVWEEAGMGAEVYYNVHRWYEVGTGRYTRVDPLGPRGDSHPYIYSRSKPIVFADPLAHKSRSCCTPIAGGPLRQFKHCFIQIETTPGHIETHSLHGMGNTRRPFGGPIGCTFENDNFDTYAIEDPRTECGPWSEDCGTDKCVRDESATYPRASFYKLRGPNSNTFAGTVSRACGLTPPSIAGGWHTPGWEKDKPSGVAIVFSGGLVPFPCPLRR